MRALRASSPAIAVVSSLAMVKEGYYFGVPPLLLGGLAIMFHWWILGGLLIAFALFCFAFFRDPERVISADPATIVSPADGKVVVITDEENAGRQGTRISIFLAMVSASCSRDWNCFTARLMLARSSSRMVAAFQTNMPLFQ